MDDQPTRTIMVPLSDSRSVALRRRDPNSWFLHVRDRVFEVEDAMLFDPLRLDRICQLGLSVTQRTVWLRSLVEALRKAGVKIRLTKAAPHIPEGGIQLNRAQRRQAKKNAQRIERLWQADRNFFERFPLRRFRLRLAGQAEIDQQRLFEGEPLDISPAYRLFMIVQNLGAGQRLRLCVVMPEGFDTDLSEQEARQFWDEAAALSPKVAEIEAEMRKLAEDKS